MEKVAKSKQINIPKKNCILFQKLFLPTGKKNCCDQKKIDAKDGEFEIVMRLLGEFIWKVKGQNNF